MRKKKTLAKSLAEYYDSVELKRVPVDPSLPAMTDMRRVTRSTHTPTARQDRKDVIRKLLLTQSKDASFASDVIRDISFEGAIPEETEIVLKPHDDGRWFTLLNDKPATKKTTTTTDKGATMSPTQTEQRMDKEETISSPRQTRVPVQRITNSALKKYRGLDALAKSVSWNDSNLEELEMQKSKSGGLKKSVSWKNTVCDTSSKYSERSSESSSRRASSPMSSRTAPERQQSVSDVLEVLRSMRAMSLAESYSLAEDDRSLAVAVPPPVLPCTVPPQSQPPTSMDSGNKKTITTPPAQSKGGRKGFLRRVGNAFKGTALSPKGRTKAIDISRPPGCSGSQTIAYAGADSKPYNVIMPLEGFGAGFDKLSEMRYTGANGRTVDDEIFGPPSMRSYDEADHVRDMRYKYGSHVEKAKPYGNGYFTNRRNSTIKAPVGKVVRREPVIQNALQREVKEIRQDIQEMVNDLGVCTRGQYNDKERLYNVPSDDTPSQSPLEELLLSGSAALSEADSSSHLLMSSSSGTASAETATTSVNTTHSVEGVEDESTLGALLKSVSSALTASDIASIPSQRAPSNGWFW